MDEFDDKCSSAHNNDSEYFDKLYYAQNYVRSLYMYYVKSKVLETLHRVLKKWINCAIFSSIGSPNSSLLSVKFRKASGGEKGWLKTWKNSIYFLQLF